MLLMNECSDWLRAKPYSHFFLDLGTKTIKSRYCLEMFQCYLELGIFNQYLRSIGCRYLAPVITSTNVRTDGRGKKPQHDATLHVCCETGLCGDNGVSSFLMHVVYCA